MNNQALLIAETKRKFYEQLQREYNYRQAIRDGLIEQCPSSTFTISDNH
jgi:hypothetical protein